MVVKSLPKNSRLGKALGTDMTKNPPEKSDSDAAPMSLDELARRMLSMPPQPKVKPKKPADKAGAKKPKPD
jgi:hypothetical protein